MLYFILKYREIFVACCLLENLENYWESEKEEQFIAIWSSIWAFLLYFNYFYVCINVYFFYLTGETEFEIHW